MINLRRNAKETAVCGTVVLAVWYATQLSGLGSAILQTTAALPVQEPRAAVVSADVVNVEIMRAADIPLTTHPPKSRQ